MAKFMKTPCLVGALTLVTLLLVVASPAGVSAQGSVSASADLVVFTSVSPSASTATASSPKLPSQSTTTIVDNRITTTSSADGVDETPVFPYTGLSLWWLLAVAGLAIGILMRVADLMSSHRLAPRSRR